MSTHTPGPWTVIKKEIPIGYAEYEIAWSPDGELVCDVVYEEADARLIAAAPDLLDAAEEALEAIADGDVQSARNALRTAIAKATGDKA